MNRLEHSIAMVNRMMAREEDRPSLVQWAQRNPDSWIDYVSGNDPKELAKAMQSRDAWRDYWTRKMEFIESVYEEETKTHEPEEPDTERMAEARAINAESRRVYG